MDAEPEPTRARPNAWPRNKTSVNRNQQGPAGPAGPSSDVGRAGEMSEKDARQMEETRMTTASKVLRLLWAAISEAQARDQLSPMAPHGVGARWSR